MNLIILLFLINQVFPLPQPPDHSFVKKVIKSKESVGNETSDSSSKKVFVKFVQGPYTFKKRREKGNRLTFSCNGCEKYSHYLCQLVQNLLQHYQQHLLFQDKGVSDNSVFSASKQKAED